MANQRKRLEQMKKDLGEPYQSDPRYASTTIPRLSSQEYQNYLQGRRNAYPNHYNDPYGSPEAFQAYKTYREHTEEADRSTNDYWEHYDGTVGMEEFASISQAQHQNLKEPAARAAADTNTHYHSRVAYLTEHPYGYSNRRHRMNHEAHAEVAGEAADLYHRRYVAHYDGSQYTPSSAPNYGPPDFSSSAGYYYPPEAEGSREAERTPGQEALEGQEALQRQGGPSGAGH
ncbi:hypothetical protein GGR55DRAFT_676221 [Xylaria sp. FL0064]|nr:hypothetical protein GGR55DRAFT_676221 [Xylaria sp. FL0064]